MKRMAVQQQQLLPDDLTTEILSYLPVRHLLKFKSVSKSWNHIISSSSFAQLHLQNYVNTPTSSSDNNDDSCVFVRTLNTTTKIWKLYTVLTNGHIPPGEFTLEADFGASLLGRRRGSEPDIWTDVVGPVNGLICIYGMGLKEGMALCNPYLQTSKTLSRSPSASNNCDKAVVDGFFLRCAGLGFDPVRRDVKVVLLSSYIVIKETNFDLGMIVDVYSRNTDTWKKFEGGVPKDTWALKPIETNNNGSFCHWVAMRDRNVDGNTFVVLSFDVRNEIFQSTLLPPGIRDTEKDGIKIFGKGNSLVLFSWTLGEQLFFEGATFLDMWVLKGLGEEGRWTRVAGIGPLMQLSKPVGLWKSHGLVLKCVRENRFVIYDYCTHEITNMDILAGDQCNPKVVEFKGSLVSLGI